MEINAGDFLGLTIGIIVIVLVYYLYKTLKNWMIPKYHQKLKKQKTHKKQIGRVLLMGLDFIVMCYIIGLITLIINLLKLGN